MSRFRLMLGALVSAVALSGCAGSPSAAPSAGPTASPTPGSSVASASGPSSSSTPPEPTTESPSAAPTEATTDSTEEPADGATSLDDATLTPAGLGPILLGMSLAEARAHRWVDRNPDCPTVWDSSPDLRAQGVSLRFSEDRLHEVLIYGGSSFTTAEGARIDMSLSDLTEIYGAKLRTEGRATSDREQPFPIVQDGEQELLFMVEPSGQLKSIMAHPYGAAVIAGC